MYSNAYNVYKNNSVNHASKEQLLLMLVDGAVRFGKVAKKAIEEKNVKEAHSNLIKAQDIYTELMVTLDVSSGEWAENMYKIYEFIKYKLGEANLTKKVEVMDEVLPLMEEVQSIWHEAERVAKGKR